MTSFFKPFLKESFPIEGHIYIIFLKHLEIISETALQPNPEHRYQNVLDFLNDLAKIEISHNWQMIPLENGCTWQCVKDDKEYNIFYNR
jgi:hypothetical protein